MSAPQAACARFELAPGAFALPRGLLWLDASRALVAADVHFAYEEVIGGALPLWSTAESLQTLLTAIGRTGARELILLGDIVHGSSMSVGAARVVGAALDRLRAACTLTSIAGNHEGRTRGADILGETFESVERDGWLLVHGDRAPQLGAGRGVIVGHLHPAVGFGGDKSAPAFLAALRLIVVPALTPYSHGLDVRSRNCAKALAALGASTAATDVVIADDECVYPCGRLANLRGL